VRNLLPELLHSVEVLVAVIAIIFVIIGTVNLPLSMSDSRPEVPAVD